MDDRKVLHSLQVLRAIAALLVVSVHTSDMLQDRLQIAGPLSALIRHWGDFGVDIFFVLSGVVMVITTVQAQPGITAARAFMAGRLRRIVPIYWALTSM